MPSNPMPVERPRRRRGVKAVALAVSVGALLVTPGLAQASTGSTVHKISNQVHSANVALSQFTSNPGGPGASAALAKLRSYSGAASKLTASVYNHAHAGASQRQAVTALTLVARQQGNEASALSGALPRSPGDLQSLIAQLIANSTAGRELALSVLNQLLPVLPAGLQATVAQLIAQLSTQSPTQVNQLVTGLRSGSIVCAATGFISEALAMGTTALQDALTRLQPLLSMLPSAIATQVQSFITGLPGVLTQLQTQITGLLPNCQTDASGTTGQGTSPTGVFGGFGQLISGVTSMITGMLSHLIPGFGSAAGGSVSGGGIVGAIGSLPGTIMNLISGLMGSIPGLGSFGNMIPFFGHH